MVAIAAVFAGICPAKVGFESFVLNFVTVATTEILLAVAVATNVLLWDKEDKHIFMLLIPINIILAAMLWMVGGSCIKQVYYSTYGEGTVVPCDEVKVTSHYPFRTGVKMHGTYKGKPCIINYRDYDVWSTIPKGDSVTIWEVQNPKLETFIYNCGL